MIDMVKLWQDNFSCIRVAVTSSIKIGEKSSSNRY